MDIKALVKQLANRINQPHVIETYLRKVFAFGQKQKKDEIKSGIESMMRNYNGDLGEYAKGRLDAYKCVLEQLKK